MEKTSEDMGTGMSIGFTPPKPPRTHTVSSMLKKIRSNIFLGSSLGYAFLVKLHPIIYLISYFLNLGLLKYINLIII